METTSLPSHSDIYNVNIDYKKCAGKGCNKCGTNPLRIIYLHKTGWFCNSCADELIKLKLVFLNEQ